MLVDESKYVWTKANPTQVLLLESPYMKKSNQPVKIYRIEGSGNIALYADETQTIEIYKGMLPYEPRTPFACDSLSFAAETLPMNLSIIAEIGEEKTVLTPFLNTTENMDYISNGYNDDNTYSTKGLNGFWYNGILANPLYISSNHWLGFGAASEQLRILRRDGCSTAIFSQIGGTTNGLQFQKIRFEGYTVYNNRTEDNRLIFELFLLSNNNIFLNMVQTPTSGNIGTSEMLCGGTATALTLADGSGGAAMVSFYHLDDAGKTWNIVYSMYEEEDQFSEAYLIKVEDKFHTITGGALTEVPITELTAAMFLKYGTENVPSKELLTPLVNPQIYGWKAGGKDQLLKANVKAYPYPQMITSTIDMSHISILGIKLMTAEYSGTVSVSTSFDNGQTFSDERALQDWLSTAPEDIWNALNDTKVLILHFILHDNAAISRFKITYYN